MRRIISKTLLIVLAALLCGNAAAQRRTGAPIQPPPLKRGDKVALISPAYNTSMERIYATAEVLRSWGYKPVIGPNAGQSYLLKFAGTPAQRLADLRWALRDTTIKAIICNRGGYGTLELVDSISDADLTAHPKWIIGFSDVTTLHSLAFGSHLMSIHGTMSIVMGRTGGTDTASVLLHELLSGRIPRYHVPPHPQNRTGKASGILTGGNLCTFVAQISADTDISRYDNMILFIEEVEETVHNVDRMLLILRKRGILERCRGIVVGNFSDYEAEYSFNTVEELIRYRLDDLDIPIMCGFPAGHTRVNLPVVIGAPVTMEVGEEGSTLTFDMRGKQHDIYTEPLYTADTIAPLPKKTPPKPVHKKKKHRR